MQSPTTNTLQGYEIANQLGTGGFGTVYRAEQISINRQVAIKIIKADLANRPDFIRRFEIEAHVIARLEHPHIVPLYDYWRDPNGAYLIMRYLRGGSLRQLLNKQGTITPQDSAVILDHIASGLDHAHRNNVVHRDIKPGNILLDEDGNAYIADFGIAKDITLKDSSMTDADGIVGSLDYLSPEQARSEQVTARTDIYSLGVTVYEMLVGRHPFHESSSIERLYKHINEPLPEITNIDVTIRDAVNEVIQTSTQKNPSHRYQNVLEFAHAFRDAVNATDYLATQLTPREYEVLIRIVDGLSNKQIAEEMFIAVSTVKTYVKNIYKKLGVRSRVQATIRAHELNLLNLGVGQEIPTLTGESYLPEPENPYKGLRPFDAADHLDFFGREALVQKLLAKMNDDSNLSRFLAIVGPSGSGKSSLVRAGVIPALWNGYLPGSDRWYTLDIVPGAHPLDELEIALARIASKAIPELHEYLWRDNRGLSRASKLILPEDDTELVIIIDQFEEIFTLVNDEKERQQFLDILHGVVMDPRSRVRIIITIRADFYDKPLHYPEFGELMRNRIETVLPLSAKELERAIVAPAERQHVVFEEGLVSHIVSEMNYESGALPLLQYALTELFEHRKGLLLTHEAYHHIGGAVGALANRAEAIYSEMNPEHQQITKQMFLRLVILGEGSGDTRRRANQSELLSITEASDVMEEVISVYTDNRLLLLDNDLTTREPTVEVAHEAILSQWQRLREWIDESREAIKMQQRLSHMAQEWQHANNDVSFLLRGSRLQRYEKWIVSNSLALTDGEMNFYHESLAQRKKLAKSEAKRQEREATLELRSVRRLRYLVGVLVVFLMVVGGLMLFAFDQQVQAQEEANNTQQQLDITRSLAMSAYALVNQEDDPFLALSLAIEAMRIDTPTDIARQIFYDFSFLERLQKVIIFPNIDADLVISPDGKYMYVSSGRRTGFYRYDLRTGNIQKSYPEKNSTLRIYSMSLSSNGRYLYYVGEGRTNGGEILDTETGEIVAEFPVNIDEGFKTTSSLSPDERLFVVGDTRGGITLWDTTTIEMIRQFPGHDVWVESITFSPDGDMVASSDAWGNIILWDVSSGESIATLSDHTDSVSKVTFNPAGDLLVSSSDDDTAKIWDIDTGEVLHTLVGHTENVNDAIFTRDGQRVLTASYDSTVKIWDVISGDLIDTYTGHIDDVLQVMEHPSGKMIISRDAPTNHPNNIEPGFDPEIHIWELEANEFSPIIAEHKTSVSDVSYSLDGSHLVSAASNGDINLWNTQTHENIQSFDGHRGTVNEAIFSPDGAYILSAGRDRTARLWDAMTGEEIMSFDVGSPVLSVAFSHDGQIAFAGAFQEVSLWDVATGDKLQTLNGHEGGITDMVITNDDKLLTSSTDTTLNLWNLEAGEIIRTFAGHEDIVNAIALSPDGTHVLSGSNDGTIKTWDISTGELVTTWTEVTLQVLDIDISPDGTTALVALSDGTVKFLDMTTGAEIYTFDKHEDAVNTVEFSPDGLTAISGSHDRTVRQWQGLKLEEHIKWVCENRVVRQFTEEERERYLIDNETSVCDDLEG